MKKPNLPRGGDGKSRVCGAGRDKGFPNKEIIMKKYKLLLFFLVFLLWVQTASANLVVNGDFETGDLTGWTVGGSGDVGVGSSEVNTGNFAFFINSIYDSSDKNLWQELPTVIGTSYTVRFYLQNGSNGEAGTPNQFMLFWGGAPITETKLIDSPFFPYKEIVWITPAATNTTNNLQFSFINPSNYWYLDDISVNAVPIPGAVWLLGSGLLGLVGLRRFRKG